MCQKSTESTNCFKAYHLLLDKRFERIDLAVVAPLDKLDLSESTLADNLQCREVVWLLLCPQEAQVFDFGTAHAVLFGPFSAVGERGLFHNGVKFESSTGKLVVSGKEMGDATFDSGRVPAEHCL